MLPLAQQRNSPRQQERPKWLKAPWTLSKAEKLSVPLTIAERIDPRDGCEDARGCPLIANPGEYVFTATAMGRSVKIFSTGVPGESEHVTLVHSADDGSLFTGGIERTPSGQWVLLKVRRQELLLPEEKIEVVTSEKPKRKWLVPLLIGVGVAVVIGIAVSSKDS